MRYHDLLSDRQIRREVTKAILCGRLKRGDRTRLARAERISRASLSPLFNPGNPKPLPAPATFNRYIRVLGWRGNESHLIENYETARGGRVLLEVPRVPQRFEALPDLPIAEMVRRLWDEREVANLSPIPAVTRNTFDAIREMTGYLLMHPDVDPAKGGAEIFASVCHLRSEIQCVLGKPWDALLHTKIGRRIVEQLRDTENRHGLDILDLHLNLIETEAVSLSNLGSRELALECLQSSIPLLDRLRSKDSKFRAERWRLQNELGFIVKMPKHSLSAVRQLHTQARGACIAESNNDLAVSTFEFAADLSLGRAYIARESWRGITERHLDALQDAVENEARGITAIHRVMFHRTYASFLIANGGSIEADEHIRNAVRIAREGSFDHQLSQIATEFGREAIE